MKNLLRSLFLCIALSAFVTLAAPQQSPSDPKPATTRENPLYQRLALSREQKAQLHAINRERKAQIEAAEADASLSTRSRREKIRDIRSATETKIRSILNQNQLEEYDQLKRERHERMVLQHETTLQTPQ